MGRWMMPQNRSPRLNLDLRGGREKSRIGNLTVEIAIANAKHHYKRSSVHVIQIFCMVQPRVLTACFLCNLSYLPRSQG